MRPPRTVPVLVLLFVLIGGLYWATFSSRRITDTNLNSLQTRTLVLHGDVDLSRYSKLPSVLVARRGAGTYSIYGVGISVVAAPMYFVTTRLGVSEGFLQGSAALLFAAGAVLVMYRLLLRLAAVPLAVGGTLIFGFGTTMWPLASMALYQHAPAALFQCLGLYGLFSRTERAPILAGFGLAMATFLRPTMAVPLVLVGLLYLSEGARPLGRYVVGALLPLAGIVVQNRWIWGTWLTGGYSYAGVGFHADMRHALWELLVGWWRGLLVYSPVLAFGFFGLAAALRRWREPLGRRLIALGAATIVTILFYARWSTWWGGLNQFGYRYLLDVVPPLVVLGVYAVSRWEALRPVALFTAILSMLTMAIGAEPRRFAWDGVLFARRLVDSSLGQSWIEFVHRPLPALLRLAGVAALGAALIALAPRVAAAGRRATSEPPLFAEAG